MENKIFEDNTETKTAFCSIGRYHVSEVGLWPVQVCAEIIPLPVRHITNLSPGEKR